MVDTISSILKKYLNREIPNDEFIFRRVHINLFIQQRPHHRLEIVTGIFRNEQGDGMSVDWERIEPDPNITQTRDGRDPSDFGVVVMSIFDIKDSDHNLQVISDQNPYPAHSLVKGIPMPLNILKREYREDFDKLSDRERSIKDSRLLAIRKFLCKKAFWIKELNHDDLKDPPSDFNYQDEFKDRIEFFFCDRGHPIPS